MFGGGVVFVFSFGFLFVLCFCFFVVFVLSFGKTDAIAANNIHFHQQYHLRQRANFLEFLVCFVLLFRNKNERQKPTVLESMPCHFPAIFLSEVAQGQRHWLPNESRNQREWMERVWAFRGAVIPFSHGGKSKRMRIVKQNQHHSDWPGASPRLQINRVVSLGSKQHRGINPKNPQHRFVKVMPLRCRSVRDASLDTA